MKKSEQNCSNCYFSTVTENLSQYSCQEAPPQMLPVQTVQGMGIQAVFPIMPPDGWCGKWIADAEAKPALTTV